MDENQKLYEKISTQIEGLKNFNPEVLEIPNYLTENIKHPLFDWQKDALVNFLFYENPKSTFKTQPTHLMFNMATGSGKTLLMAATILYFYQQGYKHFIFFVNQNNIVDKTQNNFLNKQHTKYLFKNKIVINDKTVNLKEVDVFSNNPVGIEIKFTTIHKLYNDIHLEKENKTTLNDLHKKNIVMLADEAHHLNTYTETNGVQEELVQTELTNRSGKEEVERKGWEHTVINLILNKNGQTKSKNVLLEFTATIPETEAITKKYQDKIIYKFGLKEFLSAGYTKEINLISSTLDKKERILQALLFHWYRHKIAIKYGLPNFKPVILFRSKTIEESKLDYQFFLNLVQDLSIDDFNFLNQIFNKFSKTNQPSLYEMGKSRTEQVLHFINKEKISKGEIVQFIKNNFSKRQTIITNSKTNKTQTEKTTEDQNNLLNSLENKNNHIRAIFTVQRLTEGWDVLNLYDIVRLYERGRDERRDRAGNRIAGSATIAEKQLIGRGVRYYPFFYQDKALNKRKFDDNLDHELRILEELFFYSTNDHRYIDELKRELKKDGYIKDERVFKTFQLKEDFKKSDFYKTTKIWKNERIDNPNRRRKTLKDISDEYIKPYKVKDLTVTEEIVNFKLEERPIRHNQLETDLTPNFSIKFKEIEKHIFLKAINIKAKEEGSLFQFERIKEELKIESIDDLQKPEFLGGFEVPAILNKNQKYEDVSNAEKLNMILHFLTNIFTILKDNINPQIGSQKFMPYSFEKIFGQAKTKSIDQLNQNDNIALENEWYVLDGFVGTDEEQALIDFIKITFFNLEQKYEEIYLLRNEEIYTIYDFKKGRGFCPDFILFLKGKKQNEIYYQLLIEPKGNWAYGLNQDLSAGKEGWKEEFLEQISSKYGLNEVIKAENKDYKLVGLPFFNKDNNADFIEKWKDIVN